MDNELLIYQSSEGSIKIDVRLDKDTVWLTQKDESLDELERDMKSIN